ncbi:MAG: hypothetical protein KY476_17025 [Planctomycetes bacterium]|nr:hypothetical protein [Planctomycetota bacterium]
MALRARSNIGSLAAVALLLAAGCGTPRSVVWTSDSSALIYVSDDGSIARFDLASGAHWPVVPPTKTLTVIPAVSPDGGEYAVLRIGSRTGFDVLQTVIFDAEGREVAASPPATWPVYNGRINRESPRPAAALWARRDSDGRNFLLFWYTSPLDGTFRFGVFNVETAEFKPIVETVPLVDALNVGLSPIRPDGEGFLAVRGRFDGFTNLYFVDWDGWEHPLNAAPAVRAFEERTRPDLDLEENPLLAQLLLPGRLPPPPFYPDLPPPPFLPPYPFEPRIPPLPLPIPLPPPPDEPEPLEMSGRLPIANLGWQGPVLDIIVGEGLLRANTRDQQVIYVEDNDLRLQREYLAEEKIFHYTPIGTGPYAVQLRVDWKGEGQRYVVELADRRGNRSRPLGVVSVAAPFAPIVPAPDGRKVAATTADHDGRVWTTVIDEQGRSLAVFQVSGPGWAESLSGPQPPLGRDVASRETRRTKSE